ncbi:hypothetical protein D3C86_2219750 [compost metagenome]
MRTDRLGDREADGLARIERGEGILEDVLDFLLQPLALGKAHGGNRASAEEDFT